MHDPLGDRMKMYESPEAGRKFIPLLPVVARLDGKGFSKFTAGLERPYDPRLSQTMIETTRFLVQETNAVCGYTQSDEITLAWYSPKLENQIYFDGRIQKLTSVLAAKCSVRFNQILAQSIPDKANEGPVFDCRVWQLPNLVEATNAFLWREFDATKNSVSMAARHYYEHGELVNKTCSQMQELLWQKGVNWNDYPSFFKRGTYVQRRAVITKFSPEDLEKLPEKHHFRNDPDAVITRFECKVLELPPLNQVLNRVDVIFNAAEPETCQE